MIQLTERDDLVLKFLFKYGVLSTRAIAILCKYTSVPYAYKRLVNLRKNSYVCSWYSNNFRTVLFGSGKNSLYDSEYDFFNPKLLHEYLVGETLAYLIYSNVSELPNIQTEKEYYFLNGESKLSFVPDITLVDKNVAIEIELTRKSRSRIVRKLKYYAREYNHQFWILNKDDNQIRNIINETIKKDFINNITIIDMSDIVSFLQKQDNNLLENGDVKDTIFNIDSSTFKNIQREKQLSIRELLRGE